MVAVTSVTAIPLAAATADRLSATDAVMSMRPAASGPTAIFSMYTHGPGSNIVPCSDTAITATAPPRPLEVSVVPSIGSTAMSTCGLVPSPTTSPLNNIGASSFSPSPMMTVPVMLTVPRIRRMASTAAPSAPSLSPRPTHLAAAIAAASVVRTSSMARLRSGALFVMAETLPTCRTAPQGGRGCEHGGMAHIDDEDPIDEADGEIPEERDEVEVVEPSMGGSDDEELTYDCTTWAGESRGLLASLLESRGIRHVWQGTVVSVLVEDEEAVDELIDEVMASARPALDPDAAKVVYEVGGWPAALQTMLADSLTVAELPYEWDERGDLVVYAEHEEDVEVILDDMPDPDDPEVAGEVSSDDGLAVHELLDRLFLASGRLASKDDATSVLAVDDVVAVLERMAPPFGVEPPQWRLLVGRAATLRDALAAAPGEPGALDDAELRVAAAQARDAVRQYI